MVEDVVLVGKVLVGEVLVGEVLVGEMLGTVIVTPSSAQIWTTT